MKVRLEVTAGLSMGGICVTVGDGTEVVKLSDAALSLIEAHEVHGDIKGTSLAILQRVMLDLTAAAHLISDRLELERSKVRARG